MFKKFLFWLIAYGLWFTFSTQIVFADEDFDISNQVSYDISNNGNTRVTQNISIKNKNEYIYTPSYSVTVGFKDLKNVRASNSSGSIESSVKDTGDGKTIEVKFPTRTLGVGNVNRFTIYFETAQIAKRQGSVWEISLPGISDPSDYVNYDVNLSVPASFGPLDTIKPFKAFSGRNYFFNKDEMGRSGVFMLFGESQNYSLNLTYAISNPKVFPVKTEIALPPPTSYQDIRIQSIMPVPEDLYEDGDGNWLAVYTLKAREEKIIKAEIVAQVYSTPKFESESFRGSDTLASQYWEVSDPEIKKLANELKTPEAIYTYVVNKLKYDYEKVKNNVRLGAKKSLARPDFAVCLEFTDLFVAIARAAGIPARSVEGYAFTSDEKLRPLSLVRDVLHAWPQYYDHDRDRWIMIDPTWGNTTRGGDYFNTFDFDHIAFVIKGESSTYPIPAGGYKISEDSKDVSVTLLDSFKFAKIQKTSVSARFPENTLSGFGVEGVVTIRNEGNVPVKNKKLVVSSDLNPSVQEFEISSLLPYGVKNIPITFQKTPFLTSKTFQVKISYDGNETLKLVKVGLFPNYFFILAGGILIGGSIIIAVVAFKTWSLYFQKRKK